MKNFNINENEVDKIKETTVYTSEDSSTTYEEKPEYMTSLKGNVLVNKNHKRIILRGKIDSFIADVLIIIHKAESSYNHLLVDDLNTILDFMKQLQLAEVSEKPLEKTNFLGLSNVQLREHSHHPKKYYNSNHLFNLSYDKDIMVLELNKLRAQSRELEITAFDSFFINGQLDREDILTALNRLSSAIYIIEIKAVTGMYNLKQSKQ